MKNINGNFILHNSNYLTTILMLSGSERFVLISRVIHDIKNSCQNNLWENKLIQSINRIKILIKKFEKV
jgi:hypothetical protein